MHLGDRPLLIEAPLAANDRHASAVKARWGTGAVVTRANCQPFQSEFRPNCLWRGRALGTRGKSLRRCDRCDHLMTAVIGIPANEPTLMNLANVISRRDCDDLDWPDYITSLSPSCLPGQVITSSWTTRACDQRRSVSVPCQQVATCR